MSANESLISADWWNFVKTNAAVGVKLCAIMCVYTCVQNIRRELLVEVYGAWPAARTYRVLFAVVDRQLLLA